LTTSSSGVSVAGPYHPDIGPNDKSQKCSSQPDKAM
jgi:hypothetical protein